LSVIAVPANVARLQSLNRADFIQASSPRRRLGEEEDGLRSVVVGQEGNAEARGHESEESVLRISLRKRTQDLSYLKNWAKGQNLGRKIRARRTDCKPAAFALLLGFQAGGEL
jgi:hypothetical protein